ncbi:golgin subfamily A member 6-like protein 6 [Macrobrachium rosenbergii]|uniref:golgin subfamily A member 6-like protein 6 n=1 Tax=Macrobrachium rosenbergii TaxID=79674 RepID=UPI0034D74AC2
MDEVERRLREKENLNIHYQVQIAKRDEKIHELFDKDDKMKKERHVLEKKLGNARNKLEVMERLLQEKEVEKKDLTNRFDDLIEKKDHRIEDLLAKENELKEAYDLLERNLHDVLNDNKNMERLLEEKRNEKNELTNHFDNLIENKNHQIEDLLVKEDELKKACELLEGKLREALSNNADMERLVKEKEYVKTELEVYCKTQLEKKEHKIQELLAHEENMQVKIESLEEELSEALCKTDEMEKVLKKEKDQNLELTNIYDRRTEDLYRHIKDLLAKESKLNEEKEHLNERLQDALRNTEELEKQLTKEKDQKLELKNMYERIVKDLYLHIRDLLEKETRARELENLLHQEKELLKSRREGNWLESQLPETLKVKDQEEERPDIRPTACKKK